MDNFQQDNFQTKDYCLAAALMATGNRLIKLRWKGPVAFFIFSDKDRCEIYVEQYVNNELEVKAKDFVYLLKDIKLKLFSGRETE